MVKIKMGGISYAPEARLERARKRALDLHKLVNMRGQRVLEIGCGMGDLTRILAEEYDCEVVGIDIMHHEAWAEVPKNPQLTLRVGDIAKFDPTLGENSFDRIISYVVWEHLRHPWSALVNCQRMLRPDGKKYIYAWLYGSAGASHLYSITDDHWPHLVFSPQEVLARYNLNELPWYFWCNRVNYQQYLFYFRKLGFHVSFEHLIQEAFNEEEYCKYEQILSLYPQWDLQTDAFQVVLEFDKFKPKEPIADHVYRLRVG